MQRLKRFQPAQPFVADARLRRRRLSLAAVQEEGQLGMRASRLSQPALSPQHLVGIAENSGPAGGGYFVNDLSRMRPAQHQVATLYDQVRRNLLQVGKNRLECPPVSVNIGYDRNPHGTQLLAYLLGRQLSVETTSTTLNAQDV